MLYSRTSLLVALISISSFSYGQKSTVSLDNPAYTHPVMLNQAMQWNGGFIAGDDAVAEIRSHIYAKHPEITGSALEFDRVITSPGGTHYHFYQVIQGQRVFGTQVVANVNNQNKVGMITAHLFPTEMAEGTPLMENNGVLTSDEFRNTPSRGIWFYDGQQLIPAIRHVIIDGYLYEERVADATGTVIWSHDLNNYYTDTTLTVTVFNPDPLTTFEKTYGGNYRDMNDDNESLLNQAQVTRQVPGQYQLNDFLLRNSWVEIKDFDSPSVAVAKENEPVFDYGRKDDRFEQVNAFYHLTTFQLHMQDLGFSLVNYRLPVDANALSGNDNSQFSTSTNPPRISFGEGGVDDAEDADVVIHEYGHAIAYSASPNSNSGTERGCLDEALGDYLASSYSRSISEFGYDKVFSWDGHNEFWNGRDSYNKFNKNYKNLTFNSIYTHTDIWSSALMELWGRVGRDVTDKLVLESIFGYSSNMTMVQAAYLVVQADSNLFGGQHIQPIWEVFAKRGILPANPVSLDEFADSPVKFYNTSGFAAGGTLNIEIDTDRSYGYTLTDISGRTLERGTIEKGQEAWQYSSSSLSTGIYIMILKDDLGSVYSEKLVRN